MTCIAITLTGGKVHIFSDTAAVGPSGSLVLCSPKIATFGGFAVVSRGSVFHALALRALARRCGSYDQARICLPRWLAGPAGRLLSILGDFETYVAGIAADGRPCAFMLVSHRLHDGIEPLTGYDVEQLTTGPMPDVNASDDPLAFGIAAAQLQRRVLQSLPFARNPVSIVGGALQHVEIGPDGARSEILGGWYDQIGRKLQPSAAFSPAGGKVREAAKIDLMPWLFPTSPRLMFRTFAVLMAALVAVRLALMIPGAIYVENTYGDAPRKTIESADGAYETYARFDLGKLVTVPAFEREVLRAVVAGKSAQSDHAEAARLALMDAGKDCEIVASREVLRDEFEHELDCTRRR